MKIFNQFNKMYQICKFIILNIIRLIIGSILSLFVWRNKKYILFSVVFKNPYGQYQDFFIQNSKYFFLYLSQNKTEYKPIWLTNDLNMLQLLRSHGYKNVYKRNSLKGFYYSLRAKYWISNFIPYPTHAIFSQGAVRINLWHGTGFKLQGFDNKKKMYSSYQNFIKKAFLSLKEHYHYYNANCEYEKNCHMSGYGLDSEHVKILGYPRLDSLYRDFADKELFMEKDYQAILNLKNGNKKIMLYAPTWRDTGKDISGWLVSDNINKFLSDNNLSIVVKLHPMDANKDKIKPSKNIYIMNSDSDIYAVLKYIDFMLADYSSLYSDFLLLDKPIIFYPLDLDEYLKDCVEFYRPYDEITPGIKVHNEQELLHSILDVINGIDNYKNERKKMRDELYQYQDGKSCERVLDFIRGLDNN